MQETFAFILRCHCYRPNLPHQRFIGTTHDHTGSTVHYTTPCSHHYQYCTDVPCLHFTSVYFYMWQVQLKSTSFHLYPIFSSDPFYLLSYFLIVFIFRLPCFLVYSKPLIKFIYLIFQSSSFLVNLKTQSTLVYHLPNTTLYFNFPDTLPPLCSFSRSKLSCHITKIS